MSFKIEFSYTTDGFVRVNVPTSELNGNTDLTEAPFQFQSRLDANSQHSIQDVSSENGWSVFPSGSYTTYQKLLARGFEVELIPLSSATGPAEDYFFYRTGFITAGGFLAFETTAANDTPPPPPPPPPPMEYIAPTLDPNGIQKTPFMANGSTSLPQTGKDSAYIVSFSERVSIPSVSAQSAFGGMPVGSTIVVTQMPTSSAYSDQIALFSDRWHVQVTTPTANAKVNLTLTPNLQVNSYETTSSSPPIGTGTTLIGAATTHWAKVTLNNDLYAGRTFDSGVLSVSFMDGLSDPTPLNYQTVALATSTSAKNVLYLGFPNPPPVLTLGDEIRLSTTNSNQSYRSPLGGLINDVAGNLVDGSVVSELTDTNIGSFYSQGTSGGFDVLDLSQLSNGPVTVDAEFGFIKVYDENGIAQYKNIDFYDKYIFNDRYKNDSGSYVEGQVNRFYGTEESEYVVVGNGGGNILIAGNQGSGSIVPETDILDYSKVTGAGVTVDLGNSVSQLVNVTYSDNRSSDKISGFEGVVGSMGVDIISGSNAGNYLQGGAGDDILRGYSSNNASNTPGWTFSTVIGDVMYNAAYLQAERTFYGTADLAKKAFVADSSDILVGGAGMDTLYGGAGSDFLVDLDSAVMWGSDVRGATGGLRDNNTGPAEYDRFMVRGSPTETATIENFHLSKNGTGLAGRSYDANDAIIFSANIKKLIRDAYNTTNGGSPALGEA